MTEPEKNQFISPQRPRSSSRNARPIHFSSASKSFNMGRVNDSGKVAKEWSPESAQSEQNVNRYNYSHAIKAYSNTAPQLAFKSTKNPNKEANPNGGRNSANWYSDSKEIVGESQAVIRPFSSNLQRNLRKSAFTFSKDDLAIEQSSSDRNSSTLIKRERDVSAHLTNEDDALVSLFSGEASTYVHVPSSICPSNIFNESTELSLASTVYSELTLYDALKKLDESLKKGIPAFLHVTQRHNLERMKKPNYYDLIFLERPGHPQSGLVWGKTGMDDQHQPHICLTCYYIITEHADVVPQRLLPKVNGACRR